MPQRGGIHLGESLALQQQAWQIIATEYHGFMPSEQPDIQREQNLQMLKILDSRLFKNLQEYKAMIPEFTKSAKKLKDNQTNYIEAGDKLKPFLVVSRSWVYTDDRGSVSSNWTIDCPVLA